jgi:cardiolipin synthase
MRHGVEVRTWPAMMHGKVQIVDDRWVTVGSSNLDCLSFFGNEEGNLVAARRDLATALREAIDRQFAEADPLTEARWRARPWPKKLLGRLARPLRPVL